jgi:hypothetical protein
MPDAARGPDVPCADTLQRLTTEGESMTNTVHDNYLWTVALSLDNKSLYEFSFTVEKILQETIQTPARPTGTYPTFTTVNYLHYNLFTFPHPELISLFTELRNNIAVFLKKDERYVIQFWLNIFRKGEFVNWHRHWPVGSGVFHGYYCVNVGDSVTSYMIPGNDHITELHNKDGLLVFGRSEGDKHKSSAWNSDDPRVTMAFDIIPWKQTLKAGGEKYYNHYIPFC